MNPFSIATLPACDLCVSDSYSVGEQKNGEGQILGRSQTVCLWYDPSLFKPSGGRGNQVE